MLDDAAEALSGIYEAFDREWARASASPDRFKGQPAWVEWLWMSDKHDRAGLWDIGMVDGQGRILSDDESEAALEEAEHIICEGNGLEHGSEEAGVLIDEFKDLAGTAGNAAAAWVIPLEPEDFELFPSLGALSQGGRRAVEVALREADQGGVEFVGSRTGAADTAPERPE